MTLPSSIPTPAPSSPAGARSYRKLLKLASGGMGTVHVGVLEGALGFRQVVALKEAHQHLLEDEQVRRTLIEEAQLAARIHHANVVEVRDVEANEQGITLVMPYIEGASLAELWTLCAATSARIPAAVALRIALDACAGLAAAHELTDEVGAPLGIVHRDVSPQNLLIGTDGVTRVSDFGVAKHRRSDGYSTTHGTFKGKLAYAAPEYLRGQAIDARLDVFAMGVVLWEMLTMERLFFVEGELETLERVQRHRPRKLATFAPELAPLDPVVDKALEKSKTARTATMAELAAALEDAARGRVASHRDVAAFLNAVLGPKLEERRALLRERLRAEGASLPIPALPNSSPSIMPPNSATLPAVSSERLLGRSRSWRRGAFVAGFVVAALAGAGIVAARTGAPEGDTLVPPASAAVSQPSPADPSGTSSAIVAAPPASAATAANAPAVELDAVEPPKPRASAPMRSQRIAPVRAPRRPAATSSEPPSPPPNPYAPH